MPNIFTLPGARDGPDTVGAMQSLAFNEVRTIASGTNIYASLQTLYWADHNHASVINSGRIWNISPTNVSGAITGYYVEEVRNSGLIVSEAPGGNAGAINVATGGSLVLNSGQIWAIASGNATTVAHWDPNVTLDNSGLIAAYAPTAGTAGVGDAVAVAMYNGGRLDNRAGGSILAEGLSATAVIFSRGHLIDPGIPEISNAGLIEAYATDPAKESVAILTGALTVEKMRVENSGIIRAEIAYRSTSELGNSPPGQPADEIYNLAGGRIYGVIDTRLGDDILVNHGLIQGDLMMGEGDDFVDTAGGTHQGKVDLGWGNDRFLGGAGDEAVLGGRDSDRLDGGGGSDLLLGGLGHDTILGGAGNDGLYGEYGDDRIVTAGGDRVAAGAGDDRVEVGDLVFALVDGGSGTDRLVLALGADSLDLSAVRATGRVTDFEEIETLGHQRLVVRAGNSTGLSGGEPGLRLLTTATDAIELIGGWTEISGVEIEGTAFRRFSLGGETLLVAGAGGVVVAGAPSAAAGSLDPVAAGAAAPLAGSVPGVVLSSPTTILNNYMLHDTETVSAGEIWRSTDGQPILWTYGWEFSLINHGLMESIGPGNGGARVVMYQGIDRIENYGTMRAKGSGGDPATAISGDGAGRLINHGVIEAIAEAAPATGASVRLALWSQDNFQNFGTISATTNGSAKALGASISYGDNGINDGTIAATGGDGTIGVQLYEQRRFTNGGTIAANLAAGASGSTTGLTYVASAWSSAYVNHGLISGTRAIEGSASFGIAGRADFYNFGRIVGTIALADGDGRFENWGEVVGEARLGGGRNLWFGAGAAQQGAVLAGSGGDILVGSAAGNVLNGEAGDDYLRGGGGADSLTGGAGRDVFGYLALANSTAAAPDTIIDFVTGTDRIDLSALAVQSVSLTAGAGFTQLVANTAAGSLTVRVKGSIAQSDLILAATPTINGTAASDLLVATAGGSVLKGGDGNDMLVGSAAGDRLEGGAGSDLAWGGAGNDVYLFNDGSDLIWEVTGEGTDLIEFAAAGSQLELPDNVENVTMLANGFVNGNALANVILGSSGDDSITGRGGDDLLEGRGGSDRLTGGDGEDTVGYFSAASAVVVSLAVAAAQNTGGGGVDTLAEIENLTGSGFADTLTGDGVANRLDGGGGADTMRGGAGDDVYVVDNVGDKAVENAGEGVDSVRSSVTFTLGAEVEDLVLTGAAAANATGNALANFITGNDGANRLDGLGGADRMAGGLGDDIYVVDQILDQIVEAAGAGTDTVLTAIDLTLGANLENLGANSAAGLVLTGNGVVNLITGGGGADRIDGGLGADTLEGGLGSDLYLVDAGDVVTEAADAGTDEVRTALAAYTLTANVEKLTATSASGQILTGNGLANVIIGGSGNDRIDGGGGADALAGGLGNDIYTVDAGDTVTEAANAGTDEVRTALASYGLGANVEKLTGTSSSGQILTGNGLANVISGGSGNDRLDGGGGADTLAGGLGNDVYVVVVGDILSEAANAGTDEVRTALASYVLTANVERLTGTSTSGQILTGNGLANSIAGGSGSDTLDGGGGGADTLAGGLGNDLYIVGGGDIVSEAFNAGTDEVRTALSSYVLTANVDRLTGTSASGQVLTGNGIANVITGGSGNDRLDGGSGGADTLAGGLGNDVYVVGGSDVVSEVANAGTDEVRTALGSYLLTSNVERLTGTSTSGQILTGNGIANTITGGVGNDTLDGGGGGADTLAGGLGNDIYVVGGGDGVSEAANAGTDEVRTALSSYTLTANVETLRGTATTGQKLTGNGIANTIIGGVGNDTLDGGGGGADTLAGGLGNDVYVIGGGDGVSEAANAGIDEVRTALSSYTLGANVENLRGTAASGQLLTGNATANAVTGGAGNDTLVGGGGADSLAGSGGADTFRYHSATDSAPGQADLIGDFKSGLDKIDLSRVDANSAAAGNQAFSWIGAAAFSGVAGQLRTYDSGGYRWIAGDTDGDSDADILIAFHPSAAPVGPADFLL